MKVFPSLIENCLSIIELLAAEARSMRLSEIADQLKLQRSGAHRVLTTLVGLGWVEQNETTEFYRLSLKLPAMGYRFMHGAKMPEIIQPVIDKVARESHELVRLAALSNDKLTTIAHAQGAQGSLICRSRTFPVLPLHVTASGKVWLSTLPREIALRLALEGGLGRRGEYGPNEIKKVDEFTAELDRTAERRFGIAMEEAEESVGSVAAAVATPAGEVVGVLAIVTPIFRLNDARVQELGQIARAGATELASIWPLKALGERAVGDDGGAP